MGKTMRYKVMDNPFDITDYRSKRPQNVERVRKLKEAVDPKLLEIFEDLYDRNKLPEPVIITLEKEIIDKDMRAGLLRANQYGESDPSAQQAACMAEDAVSIFLTGKTIPEDVLFVESNKYREQCSKYGVASDVTWNGHCIEVKSCYGNRDSDRNSLVTSVSQYDKYLSERGLMVPYVLTIPNLETGEVEIVGFIPAGLVPAFSIYYDESFPSIGNKTISQTLYNRFRGFGNTTTYKVRNWNLWDISLLKTYLENI